MNKSSRPIKIVPCNKCNQPLKTKSYNSNVWVCKECKRKTINKILRKYYYTHKLKHKEQRNKRNKNYYRKNAMKLKTYGRKYYQKNKDKLIRGVCQLEKYKYHNDPLFKLKKVCRHRLHRAIYNVKVNKFANTKTLIGCDWKQLKEHIENQFSDGMNWDNYGIHGWHIDHIIPCASFDLTKVEEQQKCFHYTNLQPLWAVDNLKKSTKII